VKLYTRYLKFIGQTKKSESMVKVGLSNGSVLNIVACYKGWQQYNATVEEKKAVMPIAERFNDWFMEENSHNRR
jgi:hypothetical protein